MNACTKSSNLTTTHVVVTGGPDTRASSKPYVPAPREPQGASRDLVQSLSNGWEKAQQQ